jgi:hypothetical protein
MLTNAEPITRLPGATYSYVDPLPNLPNDIGELLASDQQGADTSYDFTNKRNGVDSYGQPLGLIDPTLLGFRPVARPIPIVGYKPVQIWDCRVISRSDCSFTAALYDRQEQPMEQAEIPIDLVDEDEQRFIQKGAWFIYSLGYTIRGKRKSLTSEIRFKRAPVLTRSAMEAAITAAKEKYSVLDTDDF